MNVVMVSPHFPPNFYHFCAALRRAGANVFGIADAPYDELRPELQDGVDGVLPGARRARL